ncbi:hypothetical protein N802_15585 [Knoellia sinensis KCTC 19936]|uniref:Uncharacterized protein n=1 Tax=Knoellia sinensis KCTC 19936 TaxID=1385520 RepID=A0A0A0J6R3_9MICO|nr:hypothetical protein [Knoellia sinensis]KGN33005.1 hypothetical protein N802_15585 [Knoellia sinensis KCTC 19936]
MSSDTMSVEVRDYVAGVRAALSDLPVEDVEEFTTGMEADLAERLAEPGDGTLRDRLGDPEVYAAELRSAAGLPPRVAGVVGKKHVGERVSDWWAGVSGSVLDALPWLRDLRPVWWAVRGFSLAALPAMMIGAPITWLGLLGAAVSVAAGLLARNGKLTGEWVGPIRVIGNVLAVLLLPFAFILFVERGSYSESAYPDSQPAFGPGIWNNGEPVTTLYGYDETGRRIDTVRLYDQHGREIRVDPWHVQQYLSPEDRSLAFDPQTGEPQLDDAVFPLRWGSHTGWEGIPLEHGWDPPVAITPLPGPVPSAEASPSPTPTATATASPAPSGTAAPTASASPSGAPGATQTSPGSGAAATPTPTATSR